VHCAACGAEQQLAVTEEAVMNPLPQRLRDLAVYLAPKDGVTCIEAAEVIESYGRLADGTIPRPKQRVYFPPGYCEYDNDGIVHLAVSYEGGLRR
jgi:hypothetical protein